ncbi:type I secretion system permease/ATPase [Marivivens donghaensis]|uniref:Type I secretion system permease/ATPase n=1 Tax=Marivivens donghaensis TaxID=1699413 RepID=A0ABX0VW27_9RHOB|nr:type I secretion system permease/ATPase [Marivivens donghaensis]NIY71665.1 type I secretion system permease/ATPase [Marivivens donghaensis]
MRPPITQRGEAELVAARKESRGLYWLVAIFSFVVNILMLTGPLYMMNVYDRVMGSGSVQTLVALTVLVGYLYLCMALTDYVRGRVMGRVGARFQSRLDRRVFEASLRAHSINKAIPQAASGLRDLESIQRFIISPALMSAFDLPFMPIFFAGIFIFHPYLGYLALVGAFVLIMITIANQLSTKVPLENANRQTQASEAMGQLIRSEAEMVQSLGMRNSAFARWKKLREESLAATISAADKGGTFSSLSKALRLFLQSAMLGLGAYLALQGLMSAGAMIAGSILLGRALAPIEQIIGQWANVVRAREGWRNLSVLLSEVPVEQPRTELPKPRAILDAQSVTIVPPGEAQASLRMANFRLEPGNAVGVIGPSGAGKSTLAKAVTGVWRPAGGKIRLDGASLDQYEPDVLGSHIGYLPQRVQLLDGTIKENIARMSPTPDDAAVIKAAKRAAAHEMILKLPDGYDTRVSALGGRLSGGQIQRIGLARAMYGDPVILVLDEPNSNLDNEGSVALNEAIRTFKSEGRCVMIMAHRPAAIQECDMLMMIEGGQVRAFGPKDEVLRSVTRNHQEIIDKSGPGGVS